MPLVICRMSVEHYYVSLSLSIQALCFWQFSSVLLESHCDANSKPFCALECRSNEYTFKACTMDPSVKTHAPPQIQVREVSTEGWSLGRVYLHGNVEGKASEKNNNKP